MKLPIGDIGPCVVTWAWGEVDELIITPYLGTISLRMTDSVSDVQEEGWGDTVKDSVFAGTVMELDVPMARSIVAQLQEMLLDRSSPLGTDQVVLYPKAGCDMYADAQPILIQPMCDGVVDADIATWTMFFKAYPWRDFELTWDRSGQRIHMVHFKLFPNQDSGFSDEFGTEGIDSGSIFDLR